MKKIFYLFLLFITTFSTFSIAGESLLQLPELSELSPGVHKLETELSSGELYRYMISIPENVSNGKKIPLVVVLHYGYKRSGPERPKPFLSYDAYSIIYEKAFEGLEAIIVAPDSLNGVWSTSENEIAVATFVKSIQEKYNIIDGKTVLTGKGLGGFGVWHIASKYPDLFDAIVPVAGMPADINSFRDNLTFIDHDWKMPIYIVHAEDDQVVPFAPTKEYMEKLISEGKDVTFQSIKGIAHPDEKALRKPMMQIIPWIEKQWKKVDN